MDAVLIAVGSPIMCGIYKDDILLDAITLDGKIGEHLPTLQSYLAKHGVDSIYYARGPGSFTALKLTHIFLQTLSLVRGISLHSVDSFYFNHYAPIKAFGDKYFVYEDDKISLASITAPTLSPFVLPDTLHKDDFGIDNTPLYILPAI